MILLMLLEKHTIRTLFVDCLIVAPDGLSISVFPIILDVAIFKDDSGKGRSLTHLSSACRSVGPG